MRVGAIAAGWLVDLSLTLLFSAIVIMIVSGGATLSRAEIEQRMFGSVELMASTLLVGLSFTGIGGYVAATIARQRHVQHALGVGLLSLGLGLSSLFGESPQPLWLSAAGLALTLPFAAFGGYYRARMEAA